MTTIHLMGRITEAGDLELDLPEGLPAGEAYVTIEVPAEAQSAVGSEYLRAEPMTGEEIVKAGLVGGWEDQGITDSQAWLDEQRRKRRERLNW